MAHDRISKSSKGELNQLNVSDVYDVATDIGKEFESLINSHGPEHVRSLMQKVISALERMEWMCERFDHEKSSIESFVNHKISQIEHQTSVKRQEERQKKNKELDQLEEYYKEEINQLLGTIKRLQDQNRKLNLSLSSQADDSAFSEDEGLYFEVNLVNKLQSTIENQRQKIKELKQTITDLKTENEEKSLRKNTDKIDAELIGHSSRDNPVSLSDLGHIIYERNSLKARLNELEDTAVSLSTSIIAHKSAGEDDLPVEGPLPEDPIDAPWNRNEDSRIRKLFSFISNRVTNSIINSGEQKFLPL